MKKLLPLAFLSVRIFKRYLKTQKTCFFLVGALLGSMKAHQKDGFFVEGGFETGMLQTSEQEVSYKESYKEIYNTFNALPFSSQALAQNASFDLTKEEISKLKTPYISTQGIKVNSVFGSFAPEYCDYGCNGFDTKHMVEVSLDEYNNLGELIRGLIINNYMPYSLNGLELIAIPKKGGKPIIITTLGSVGGFSSVTLDKKFNTKQLNFINKQLSSSCANMDNDTAKNDCDSSVGKFNNEYRLELVPSSISDYNTKRVMNALNQITVGIDAEFSDAHFTTDKIPERKGYKGKPKSVWGKITLQDAKMYISMLIDLAYVFSSKTWAEDILNAPFVFSNSLPIGLNGKVNWKEAKAKGIKGSIISKHKLINSFRGSPLNGILYLNILSSKAWDFLGLSTTWSMGVKSEILNPEYNKILSDPNLINGKGARSGVDFLEIFLHEYSHTRGWNSDFGTGNMTYPNVPKNPHPTKECPQGDYCINGKGVLPGYVGVSAQAWTTLAKEDKLPVMFSPSGPIAINEPPKNEPKPQHKPHEKHEPHENHKTEPKPQHETHEKHEPHEHSKTDTHKPHEKHEPHEHSKTESKNNRQTPIKIHSTPSNPFHKESHHNDEKNNPFNLSHTLKVISRQINHSYTHSAMVGFDFKMGYQRYFNDFLGLAYYGLIKYNHSNLNLSSVSQIGLGVGVDLLVDFFNSYKASHYNDNFLSSLGGFIGFRGLYNGYGVFNLFKNTGNLDFTTGINYRFKHSKYSIGVALPLIQHDMKVLFDKDNMQGVLVLKEGVSHFNVFFNYGWVF
ncbi:hypothetical protein [Helicobacter cetorum]|uniref:hypothetical protein n=1 Tax=Helicobacter cetorum TaxID=138563 RepID=UPI000CF01C44|nr:hypothetical protein [Helicobacter cetorum]